MRLLCKRLRFAYDPDFDGRLWRRIESMYEAELGRIVRAFSVYFQLVNVAERYHRVSRRREYEARDDTPQRASLRNALARVEREGVLDAEGLERLLDEMSVRLVLTAHPTEAQRRSIRRKHQEVAEAARAVRRGGAVRGRARQRDAALRDDRGSGRGAGGAAGAAEGPDVPLLRGDARNGGGHNGK